MCPTRKINEIGIGENLRVADYSPPLFRAETFLLAVQNEPPVVTGVQFFAESSVRERFFPRMLRLPLSAHFRALAVGNDLMNFFTSVCK